MSTAATLPASRRGHPLELFPVFRRWPRSVARDLLYTAVWNTLVALVLSVALHTFGNMRPSFLTLFGYALFTSQCVGFPIHGALRLLEQLVPRSANRTLVRLLDLAAIVLGSAFGIMLSSSVLSGSLPALHSGTMVGLLVFGLVIGAAMLAVLVAGERRLARWTREARQQE